ncbi:unnamed protein product, partial [Callosobruchus maculatus]
RKQEEDSKRRRKCWVRKCIHHRTTLGIHEKLLTGLRNEDPMQRKHFRKVCPFLFLNFSPLLVNLRPQIM